VVDAMGALSSQAIAVAMTSEVMGTPPIRVCAARWASAQ
jgi:hypothetical protein